MRKKEAISLVDCIERLIENHKEELERFKLAIIEDPKLIDVTKRFEVGIACLDKPELEEVISYLQRIDSEILNCVVGQCFGYYEDVTGEEIPMHLEKRVEYDSLARSAEIVDNTLIIETKFHYTYYEESKNHNGEITKEEFQIKTNPRYFVKMTEREWDMLDPFSDEEDDYDYDYDDYGVFYDDDDDGEEEYY